MEWTSYLVFVSAFILASLAAGVVSVAAPGTPVVTGFPDSNTAIEGNLVDLSCSTTGGDPDPNLRWYKDASLVDSTFILTVSGSTRTTTNTYSFVVAQSDKDVNVICTANNTQDTVSAASESLDDVYVTPSNPTMEGSSTVTAGDSNTYFCTTTRGYPAARIIWSLDGAVITGDQKNITVASDGTYTVRSKVTITVTAGNDGSNLMCSVSHTPTLTSSKTTTKTLTVIDVPTVSIAPTTRNVLLGNDVMLTCTVVSTNLPSYTVAWYKSGTSAALTSGTDYSLSGDTITILSAALDDGGNYYCIGLNSVGTSSNSNNIAVVLYTVPSNVVFSPISVTVAVGASFNITCSATVTPANSISSYKWTKVGSTTTLSTSASYQVGSAAKSDTGTYTCEVVNDYGSASANVDVDIQSAPGTPVVTGFPDSNTAIEGNLVDLSCSTTGGDPDPNLRWYKDASLVDSTFNLAVSGSTRTTTNTYSFVVAQSDKDVNFICTANNTQDTVSAASESLDHVYVTPSNPTMEGSSTVTAGDSNTYFCTTTRGYPAARIIWSLDGAVITGDQKNITVASDGTYTVRSKVTITVTAGNDGSNLMCSVSHTPTLTSPITITKTLTVISVPSNVVFSPISVTVAVGASFNITCSATVTPANSISSYKWTKVGSTTTLSTSASYQVGSAAKSDTGTYTCEVVNDYGSASANVDVDIQSAPGTPVVTGFPDSNTAIEGNLVDLSCSTTGGDPDPNLRWYKDASLVDSTFNLAVSGSTRTTTNTYSFVVAQSDKDVNFICTANNTQDTVSAASESLDHVYVTPSNPTMEGSSTVTAGDSNTYFCTTTRGYPAARIIWSLDGAVITGDQKNITVASDGTYTVRSKVTITVTAGNDGSNLMCSVSHTPTLTSPITITKTLTVISVPSNVVFSPISVTVAVGASFNITCSATVTPANSISSYKWTKVGSTTTLSTSASYQVGSAAKSDTGTYTCEVVNDYGSASANVDVDIQYIPVSTETTSTYSQTVGTSLTLSCDTDANPAVITYVWQKGSTLLSVTTKANSIQVESGSTKYTCRAENSVGQSADITFTVTGTASTNTNTGASAGASTGDTTTLSTGVIVAIVLAIIFIILIIIIIVVCCICSGSCRKKDKKKKKGRITPKPQPRALVYQPRFSEKPPRIEPYTDSYYTPRHKARPYRNHVDVDMESSDGYPGYGYVYGNDYLADTHRNHVDVDMESSDGYPGYGYVYGNDYLADTHRSTTSRFVLRAPPTAVESENGTIISVYDDSQHLAPKRKRPVHLSKDHTYDELEKARHKRRLRKKKRDHKRESGEGEESPPRKERRERDDSERSKRSKHRGSRREEGENGVHGYMSDDSPSLSHDNLVINN